MKLSGYYKEQLKDNSLELTVNRINTGQYYIAEIYEYNLSDTVLLTSDILDRAATFTLTFKPSGSNNIGMILKTTNALSTTSTIKLKNFYTTVTTYTAQSITSTICNNGGDKYRFGYNGMEKDNEVKGIGNSLNFGARMYDSRLGRWLSTDFLYKNNPNLTPYRFAFNNPNVYVDPDGNTEYWSNNLIWIGTDGNSNGINIVVRDKKIEKKILKQILKGNTYTEAVPEESSFVLPHIDVLKFSLVNLNEAKTLDYGDERWQVLKYNEGRNSYDLFKSGISFVKGYGTGEIPPPGDVLIHNHSYGFKPYNSLDGQKGVYSTDATEASGNDEFNDRNFIYSITTGKDGRLDPDKFRTFGDYRADVIKIVRHNMGVRSSKHISPDGASRVINSDRGRNGKKYEKVIYAASLKTPKDRKNDKEIRNQMKNNGNGGGSTGGKDEKKPDGPPAGQDDNGPAPTSK